MEKMSQRRYVACGSAFPAPECVVGKILAMSMENSRREKVGRKSDAVDLLNKRRNERRVGVKMPDNLRNAGLRFGILADDIETYSKAHPVTEAHSLIV